MLQAMRLQSQTRLRLNDELNCTDIIIWFSNFKLALHSLNKPHMVMKYCFGHF